MSNEPILDVLIVGAGPTGLLLAAELSRRDVRVALVERRPHHEPGTRAIGVHAPVLAALEPSGATERILSGAARVRLGIARSPDRVLGEVRFDRMNTRFPFVATVPQAVTESAVALGGPLPRRGTRVVSIAEAQDRVIVTTQSVDGVGELHARTVVIAAGSAGRELVTRGQRLSSRVYPDRYLMTDLAQSPTQPTESAVIYLSPDGVLESFPLPSGGRRLVAWDAVPGPANHRGALTDVERLQQAVARRTGDDALASEVNGASSFGIRRMLLRRLRAGRIIAIGDTAHEISPIGGQGMNLGLLDAVTLAPPLSRWLLNGDAASELDLWENRRLTSARTAARLSSMNTALGRSRSEASFRASAAVLGVTLTSPLSRLAARAYAMGFDQDSTISLRGHQ